MCKLKHMAKGERGRELERGAPHTQRKGTWGPQNAEVELREGRTSLMRGPHKVLGGNSKV
jgi:hypothetical protein